MKKRFIVLLVVLLFGMTGCRDALNKFENIKFQDEIHSYIDERKEIVPTITGVPKEAKVDFDGEIGLEVGEYAVKAIITQKGYETLVLTKKIIIEKGVYQSGVLTLTRESFLYTGESIQVEIRNPKNVEYTKKLFLENNEVTEVREAGEYHYLIDIAGGKNYNDRIGLKLAFRVVKNFNKEEIKFEDETVSYTGAVIIPSISNVPEGAKVEFKDQKDNKVEGVGPNTGKHVVYAVISLENYESLELRKVITITKAKPVVEDFVFEQTEFEVTGENIELKIINPKNFNYQLQMKKENELVTAIVDAGTYQVTVYVLGTTNIEATELTYTIVVSGKSDSDSVHPFISEYFEGGYDKDFFPKGNSSSKALELYNPTTEVIDLNEYSIWIKGAKEYNIQLEGMIQPHHTFLVVNNYSAEDLKLLADQLSDLFFSGIQSVALCYQGKVVDVIGDPEASYSAWEGIVINGEKTAATDGRLLRRPGVTASPVFIEEEWLVIRDQDYIGLNNHTHDLSVVTPSLSYIYHYFMFEVYYLEFDIDTTLPLSFAGIEVLYESYYPEHFTDDGQIITDGEENFVWMKVGIFLPDGVVYLEFGFYVM